MGVISSLIEKTFELQLTTLISCIILLIWTIASIWNIVYRLFFHPLAKFPGPKLAAATHMYEICYDYFGHGAYLWEIERMHHIYGPVVRVNPIELSIKDSEYYDKLYVNGNVRRTEALATFGDGMDFNESHGMTVDHHRHRQRRKPLEPFFSKAGVIRFEPALSEITMTLSDRLKEYSGTGEVIRLDHAFAAFAGDIVSRLCIENPSVSFLYHEEFNPDWYNLFHKLIMSMPIFMNFTWIIKIVRRVPVWVLIRLDPRSQMFRDWREMSMKEIELSLQKKAAGDTIVWSESSLLAPTLFDHLVHSDLPQSELSLERLASEAQVLMGAGTVTTAQSMSHLVVYILLNPDVESRLRKEIAAAMINITDEFFPSITELEDMPYLQACIKEGLRLSHGLMHRLPRVSPDIDLEYDNWIIPRGTPVGMSAYFMHTDESVYPNPLTFCPERWLGDINPDMNRNFVAFSRGSRRCIAPILAKSEIAMVLVALFAPSGPKLQLFDTDASDVDPACAFLLPLPRLDSKGVRVVVN